MVLLSDTSGVNPRWSHEPSPPWLPPSGNPAGSRHASALRGREPGTLSKFEEAMKVYGDLAEVEKSQESDDGRAVTRTSPGAYGAESDRQREKKEVERDQRTRGRTAAVSSCVVCGHSRSNSSGGKARTGGSKGCPKCSSHHSAGGKKQAPQKRASSARPAVAPKAVTKTRHPAGHSSKRPPPLLRDTLSALEIEPPDPGARLEDFLASLTTDRMLSTHRHRTCEPHGEDSSVSWDLSTRPPAEWERPTRDIFDRPNDRRREASGPDEETSVDRLASTRPEVKEQKEPLKDTDRRRKIEELSKAAGEISKTLHSISHDPDATLLRASSEGELPPSTQTRSNSRGRARHGNPTTDVEQTRADYPRRVSPGRALDTQSPTHRSPTHPDSIFHPASVEVHFVPESEVLAVADITRRVKDLEREKWERERRAAQEAEQRIKNARESITTSPIPSSPRGQPDPFPTVALRLAAHGRLLEAEKEKDRLKETVGHLERECARMRARRERADKGDRSDRIDRVDRTDWPPAPAHTERPQDALSQQTVENISRTIEHAATALRISRLGIPGVFGTWSGRPDSPTDTQTTPDQQLTNSESSPDRTTFTGMWTAAIDCIEAAGELAASCLTSASVEPSLARLSSSARSFDRTAGTCLARMAAMAARQKETDAEVEKLKEDAMAVVSYARELEEQVAAFEALERLERERRWSGSGSGSGTGTGGTEGMGEVGPLGRIERAVKERGRGAARTRRRTRTGSLGTAATEDRDGAPHDSARSRSLPPVRGGGDTEVLSREPEPAKNDSAEEENRRLKEHAAWLEGVVREWKDENARLRDLLAHPAPHARTAEFTTVPPAASSTPVVASVQTTTAAPAEPVDTRQSDTHTAELEVEISRLKKRCAHLERAVATRTRVSSAPHTTESTETGDIIIMSSPDKASGTQTRIRIAKAREGKDTKQGNGTTPRATDPTATVNAVEELGKKLDAALERKEEQERANVLGRVDDLVKAMRNTEGEKARVEELKEVVEDHLARAHALEVENAELSTKLNKYRSRVKHSETVWVRRFEEVQRDLMTSREALREYEAAWRALEGVFGSRVKDTAGADDVEGMWRTLNGQAVARAAEGMASEGPKHSRPVAHPLPFQPLVAHVMNLHASSAHSLARLRDRCEELAGKHEEARTQADHFLREFNASERERRNGVEMVERERKRAEDAEVAKNTAEGKLARFVNAYGAVYGAQVEMA